MAGRIQLILYPQNHDGNVVGSIGGSPTTIVNPGSVTELVGDPTFVSGIKCTAQITKAITPALPLTTDVIESNTVTVSPVQDPITGGQNTPIPDIGTWKGIYTSNEDVNPVRISSDTAGGTAGCVELSSGTGYTHSIVYTTVDNLVPGTFYQVEVTINKSGIGTLYMGNYSDQCWSEVPPTNTTSGNI